MIVDANQCRHVNLYDETFVQLAEPLAPTAPLAGQTEPVSMILADAMDHSDGGIAVIPD